MHYCIIIHHDRQYRELNQRQYLPEKSQFNPFLKSFSPITHHFKCPIRSQLPFCILQVTSRQSCLREMELLQEWSCLVWTLLSQNHLPCDSSRRRSAEYHPHLRCPNILMKKVVESRTPPNKCISDNTYKSCHWFEGLDLTGIKVTNDMPWTCLYSKD